MSATRCSATPPPRSSQEEWRTLLCWLLPDHTIFSTVPLHGNTKWLPRHLVFLALVWAWSDARCLTDAFAEALPQVCDLFPGPLPSTYQGLMNALLAHTAELLPLLRGVLHLRMRQIGGRFWRVDGWVPLAFDGSRCTAPRTRSNEAGFCARTYGKGKTATYRKKKSKGLRRRQNRAHPGQPPAPQTWLTLLWHMGLRLPWSWRIGPSNASERAHAAEMLAEESFPAHTLFCGDAGFVGYDFWSGILSAGHHFLVRVGGNVNLLAEADGYVCENKGRQRHVLCWPAAAKAAGRPPLRLRLFRVRIGKATVWLLTSVLERERLTVPQAERFYRLRWGVEIEFRNLKQTMARGSLRCRTADRLLVELEWSLMALAVAELFATKEQSERRVGGPDPAPALDPKGRSLTATLRVIRRSLRGADGTLAEGLRAARTDGYQRKKSKKAWYRPPNPDKKPLGEPKIRRMEGEERSQWRQLREKARI